MGRERDWSPAAPLIIYTNNQHYCVEILFKHISKVRKKKIKKKKKIHTGFTALMYVWLSCCSNVLSLEIGNMRL